MRKPREYERVYRSGHRIRGAGFTLIVQANGLERNRLGISIHRMIRGAVRRNRIKRMIREVFRLHRRMFPAGSDIVVTVAPGFRYPDTSAVQKAFAVLLRGGEAVPA